MKVRVSNIQRFSLQDGSGIRTTVFLKGCNLRCPWCSNPENIDFQPTEFINANTGERGVFGQDIDELELFEKILKDKEYYIFSNGGVTFSGGEPLLQIEKLLPLLKKLKEENINICIETALQVPTELVKKSMNYIDEYIVDIKILNPDDCKEILNGNIKLYNENVKLLSNNKKINIFRIPLINEYTLKDENIKRILDFLKEYKAEKIEIFKIHNLADSKYQSIGQQTTSFSEVADIDVEKLYKKIKSINNNVEIIKI